VRRAAELISAGLLCGATVACGPESGTERDCVQPPCPVPLASQLRITSQAGGPVADAAVEMFGSASGRVQCNVEGVVTRCRVPGDRGTYQLRISAPGFRSSEITVVVSGSDSSRCGCPTVQAQDVDIVLMPSQAEEGATGRVHRPTK
jgi:hypothetical protein